MRSRLRPMSTQGPVAVCDLDGVIWLADTAIEGAANAVAALRAAGYPDLVRHEQFLCPRRGGREEAGFDGRARGR